MEERQKQILGLYEELKGVIQALPKEKDWMNDTGFSFTNRANMTIERVRSVCPEIIDLDEYLLSRDFLRDGREIVNTISANAKLSALAGRLKGVYDLETQQINSGHTFIQNQSQTQTQYLATILDLSDRIAKEIPNHTEGTKERSFLEKVRAALPTVKNIIEILSLALQIGAELKLDPATIQKLLGL